MFFASGGTQLPGTLCRRRSHATGPVDTLLTRSGTPLAEVALTRATTRFVLRIVSRSRLSRDIVGWPRDEVYVTPYSDKLVHITNWAAKAAAKLNGKVQ